jgi:hypothetical protein
VLVTVIHDVMSIFAVPRCSNTQGIIRKYQMNNKLLSIISASVKVNKLLPVLFLFAGFQVNATIISHGVYSYDDSTQVVTDDEYTWLRWDYVQGLQEAEATSSALAVDGRFALASQAQMEGLMAGWFGEACATAAKESSGKQSACGTTFPVSFADIFGVTYEYSGAITYGYGSEGAMYGYAEYTNGVFMDYEDASWSRSNIPEGRALAYVFSTNEPAQNLQPVPEPSIITLFGLGLVGIGFARRRLS